MLKMVDPAQALMTAQCGLSQRCFLGRQEGHYLRSNLKLNYSYPGIGTVKNGVKTMSFNLFWLHCATYLSHTIFSNSRRLDKKSS